MYKSTKDVMLGHWITSLKFKNDVSARLILHCPFFFLLPLFYKLGWLPINYISNERHVILFKKNPDGRAQDCLSEKLSSLKYCKSQDTRSPMPYRLPISSTNIRQRMLFFFNALQLWNGITYNDVVYSSDLKMFAQ